MNSEIDISNKFKAEKQVTGLILKKCEGGRGKEERLLPGNGSAKKTSWWNSEGQYLHKTVGCPVDSS